MKKELVEFIGTFFLVLTIGLSGNAFAIGAVLITMIYMGGHISGAHYNPAVSLGLFLQKKLTSKEFLRFVVAQMLGGLLASFIIFVIHGYELFLPSPAIGVAWHIAFISEFIFTLALVFVVLNVVLPKKVQGNQYYGLAIGLVVIAGALSVGGISGGAFNPAVGISPLLFDFANIGNHMNNILLYLLAPLAGGYLASLAYSYLNPKD